MGSKGKAATLVMLHPSAPAREPKVRMHAPSQPLMRSPLSRSQTPTVPRRASRFFRVWLLFRLPCRADHSAYFGLARFIAPILSAVDADQTKQLLDRCQRNSQHENEISVNGIVEKEALVVLQNLALGALQYRVPVYCDLEILHKFVVSSLPPTVLPGIIRQECWPFAMLQKNPNSRLYQSHRHSHPSHSHPADSHLPECWLRCLVCPRRYRASLPSRLRPSLFGSD